MNPNDESGKPTPEFPPTNSSPPQPVIVGGSSVLLAGFDTDTVVVPASAGVNTDLPSVGDGQNLNPEPIKTTEGQGIPDVLAKSDEGEEKLFMHFTDTALDGVVNATVTGEKEKPGESSGAFGKKKADFVDTTILSEKGGKREGGNEKNYRSMGGYTYDNRPEPEKKRKTLFSKQKASPVAWLSLSVSFLTVICVALVSLYFFATKADKNEIVTFKADVAAVQKRVDDVTVVAANAFDASTKATDTLTAIDGKVVALTSKVDAQSSAQNKRDSVQDRILRQLSIIEARKKLDEKALSAAVKPADTASSPVKSKSVEKKAILKEKAVITEPKVEKKPSLLLSKAANITPLNKEGLTIVRMDANEVMCIFAKKGQKPNRQKYVLRKLEAECLMWEDDLKTGKVK